MFWIQKQDQVSCSSTEKLLLPTPPRDINVWKEISFKNEAGEKIFLPQFEFLASMSFLCLFIIYPS